MPGPTKRSTMNNMKKIVFLGILIFTGILIFNQPVSAAELGVDFFYSETCLHCAAEQKFLDEIKDKYSEIKINYYLTSDLKNHALLKELLKKHDAEKYLGLVPLTFIGEDLFIGFDAKISKLIEESIQRQLQGQKAPGEDKNIVHIPIIGKIDTDQYSLPALSIILGVLDGFNICSLGALILILGIILALRSRKKVLIFGGIFILTTAIIYGLLILLWHQLFSLLASYQKIMALLIGLLCIGGGIYFLKEFIKFKKHGPACEAKGQNIVTKFSARIQETLKKPRNIIAIILSILVFAVMITIIEFPCSAAIPVVFAGILAKSQLPSLLYFFYIALFVIFYMLDEILVFLIAFFTMKLWLSSPKFVTWITLTEAIILFLLGFYYLTGF